MLDEEVVLEHRDLGVFRMLADGHFAFDRFAAGQEFGLGHDGRAAATGFTAFAATLLLGFEPGRTADAGDLVFGRARFAHTDGGVFGVVGRHACVLAGTTAPAPAQGRVAVFIFVIRGPSRLRGTVVAIIVEIGVVGFVSVCGGGASALRGIAATTATTAAATATRGVIIITVEIVVTITIV